MKIVFVQPYYHNIWEALGIGYIISYLKENYTDLDKLSIDFYQAIFDKNEDIIEGCKDADYVAFSCTSPVYKHAKLLAGEIKKINKKVKTIFGGWHITALPDVCIQDPEVDQVVVGEGEEALLSIINGNTDPIVYGTRLGFEDLSWPDRKTIKNERTIKLCESINGKRITSFQGNRVCPVSCVFCAEKIMSGRFSKSKNPIRSRHPGDILNEIEYVYDKFNITDFKFVDATFDISPEYVINFCQEKISRDNKLGWEALIHAGLANEEMFYWLREAGCTQINVGCESGSDKIHKDIKKGVRVEHIENTFKWAKTYNIERRGFFILGMPNETEEDIQLTEKLIEKISPDVVGFTILCPYPGCALYNHEKYGHIDWSITDEYSNDFWETEHFTNKQLKEKQSYLSKKYKKLLCERQDLMIYE